MSTVKFNKYAAALLLLVAIFVAANVVHDATHTLYHGDVVGIECDSCHLLKVMHAHYSGEILALNFDTHKSSIAPVLGAFRSTFSFYGSRAPPLKVLILII